MNSFGKSVAKGAGMGALTLGAVTADSGNPLANAAVGAVVGGIAGGIKAAKDASSEKKTAKSQAAGYAKAKARHAALSKGQFK